MIASTIPSLYFQSANSEVCGIEALVRFINLNALSQIVGLCRTETEPNVRDFASTQRDGAQFASVVTLAGGSYVFQRRLTQEPYTLSLHHDLIATQDEPWESLMTKLMDWLWSEIRSTLLLPSTLPGGDHRPVPPSWCIISRKAPMAQKPDYSEPRGDEEK